MINKHKVRSEAVRLGVTTRDVRMLYRQHHSQRKNVKPMKPVHYVAGGNKNATVQGKNRVMFFDLPRVSRKLGGIGSFGGGSGGEVEVVPFKSSNVKFGGELSSLGEKQPKRQKRKKKRSKKRRDPESIEQMDFGEEGFHLKVDKKQGLTVGTQTDYRESEAQTDPYTHTKVKVKKGTEPEVLLLKDLTYKSGLHPVTKATIKEIDRARRRKHIESNLPMGRDKDSFNLRCKQLKKLELQEWNEREEKVKLEQDKKFKKLENRINIELLEEEEENQVRIDNLSKKVFADLQKKLKKLELKRGKALQKTLTKYENPEKRKKKKDIFSDESVFHDSNDLFGSGVSFRKPISGSVSKMKGLNVKSTLLRNTKVLESIERRHLKQFDVDINKKLNQKINEVTSSDGFPGRVQKKKLRSQIRKETKIIDDIHFAQKVKQLKVEKKKKNKNLLLFYKKIPRAQRPETPQLEFNDAGDDLENAIITIQKLLRGRATQNKFCFAKEKALELIRELQLVEEVVTRERKLKKEEDHIKKELEKQKEKDISLLIENVSGEIVGRYLDYLSKELVRQEELKKLEVLKVNAEMKRVEREKKETSRRKTELKIREKREEKYKQLTNNNVNTVDSYIDQIFESSVQSSSYRSALEVVKDLVKKKRNEMKELRDKEKGENNKDDTPKTDEHEIKDLVESFLFPQVKREFVKKKVILEQNKYLRAVHESLQTDDLTNIGKNK